MLNAFREAYEDTVGLMKQNKREIVWDFSPTYVFGLAQMFLRRLEKVRILFDVSPSPEIMRLFFFLPRFKM